MRRLLKFASLFAFSFGIAFASAQDIETLISEASESRTADPGKFVALLENLENRRSELSPAQANFVDYLIAYRLAFSGDFEAAIAGYREVLEATDDPELAYRVGYSLVNVYSITRNWTQGLVQLNETMELQGQVGDQDVLHSGWIGAAIFYNQLEQFDLALDFTERLVDEELSDRNLCVAIQLQVEAKLALGLLDPDSGGIDDALSRCTTEPVAKGLIAASVAQAYVESGQALNAQQELTRNLEDIESTGYKRLIAEAYGLLSQAEFSLGNGPQAAEYAAAALQHAEGFPMSEPALQAYWTLKEYHKQQEDFREALDYEVLYAQTKEGIQDERADKQLAVELARRDVVQKNQQIELLKQQNSVLQLSEQLASETAANDRLLLYFVIVIAAILAAWGHYLYRTQRRLRALAEQDTVTGLNNRRHFTSIAQKALRNCQTRNTDACFVILDLDRFKRVNDTYGHAAGDIALRAVSAVLDDIAYQGCLVGRLGGEEFALLFPECDIKSGARQAEHCRRAIASIDSSHIGEEVVLTASFGVTSLRTSGPRLEHLMRDADHALYEAKNGGRNQVVTYDREAPHPLQTNAVPNPG